MHTHVTYASCRERLIQTDVHRQSVFNALQIDGKITIAGVVAYCLNLEAIFAQSGLTCGVDGWGFENETFE